MALWRSAGCGFTIHPSNSAEIAVLGEQQEGSWLGDLKAMANDHGQWIGTLAVIAGFIWGAGSWVLETPEKQIAIKVETYEIFNPHRGRQLTSPTALIHPGPLPIEVLDKDGKNIEESVYIADVSVWNTGKTTVHFAQLREPLDLNFVGTSRILRIVNVHADTRDEVLGGVGPGNSRITMAWRFMDPGKGFRLRVYYVASEPSKVERNLYSDVPLDNADEPLLNRHQRPFIAGLVLALGLFGAKHLTERKGRREPLLLTLAAMALAVGFPFFLFWRLSVTSIPPF